MQGVSKEWLDFLRNQFPAGSRIQTWELDDPRNTLEEAGTLEHIDDSGRFHVRQSDGGECVLTLGEEMFSVHPPESTQLKLYMPLTASFYARNEWGDWDETGEEWDGRTLLDYEDRILGFMVRNRVPEEQAWLRERLEVWTVREGIALDAAIQRHPAQDSTEVVSLLASLDEYEVLGGIQSYEDLGLYYLEETNARLLALRDYIDLDKLGRRYEKQHPGLFAGGCYVVCPEREQPEVYDGIALPEPDYSWSLRLKLASSAVPEGVWLALPDYNDIMDVRPGEIRLALDALGVQTIRVRTLANVCLPA